GVTGCPPPPQGPPPKVVYLASGPPPPRKDGPQPPDLNRSDQLFRIDQQRSQRPD
ncbi:hypothetical protein U1Q18_037166, partial [Sarracenia purpurea var. burkii]